MPRLLRLPSFALCTAAFLALSGPLHASPPLRLDLAFEGASGRSFDYPPPRGERFGQLANQVSGWGESGRIRVTHGDGYGVSGSGGIYAEIIESSDRFLQVNVNNVTLPGRNGETLTRDLLRSLEFAVDLKMPLGRTLEIHLSPVLPAEMRPRAFPNRLVLGRFTGTGDFAPIRVSGLALPDENLTPFLNTFRDATLNGHEAVTFNIVFYIGGQGRWETGDSLQLDNLRLQIGR
jgi:hypothetical protein